MSKDDFWGKKDVESLARSLRLAVIQNQYDAGNLTTAEAVTLLSGPLSPGGLDILDADCLTPRDNPT